MVSRRLLSDHGGASAIEFALVLPLFLLLIVGLIAYGLYFGAAHATAQLAADAARSSVAGISDAERAALARDYVTRNAAVYALINPQYVTALAATSPTNATDFRVTVRYDSSALPIWRFAPFLPLPSRIIERSATIRRGGY